MAKNNDDFLHVTMKMKIENADLYGYNAEALRVYMALAGYPASIEGVSEIIEMSRGSAQYRFASGDFKRIEIQRIIEKLQLTPQQVMDIFFTSKEGIYRHKKK